MFAASILPGLRHVRTPLVTGYLYFVALWLVLGSDRIVPERAAPSSWERRLAELIDLAGASGTALGVSLAAYLVGSMLVIASDPVNLQKTSRRSVPQWLAELHAWAKDIADRVGYDVTLGFLLEHPAYTSSFKQELRRAWTTKYGVDRGRDGRQVATHRIEDHLHDPVDADLLAKALVAGLTDEFDLLTVRLQIERESLWNDYDRLRSEAELRFSIGIPLAILAIVTSVTWSTWALFGLGLPTALYFQAVRTDRRARMQIWTAVIHEVIESPTVIMLRKVSRPVAMEPVKPPHRSEFPEPKGGFLEAVAEALYLWRAPHRERRMRRRAQQDSASHSAK